MGNRCSLDCIIFVAQIRGGSPLNGDYVGLQSEASLTPDEKDTEWFHENTLLVRDNQAILDMVPVFFKHGEKGYSASDGGFLTYPGKFFQENGHDFVALRLFQSDYIIFRVGQKPYNEVKVYPVKYAADEIEINGVHYKRTTLDQQKQKYLLDLMKREPADPDKSGER